MRPPLIVITGPTATGKTEVGAMVAEMVGGEVVSADSMLIYRGMDIGTAKPDSREMRGIPHHMLDIVEPDHNYSVAMFQLQAREVIAHISGNGKIPLLVGGTGLYIRAVIDDYDFTGAPGDKSYRERLQQLALESGPELLHKKLGEVDPKSALKLHPGDTRRIIRALEVYNQTGKPISDYQRIGDKTCSHYNLFMFGLTLSRPKLYHRIEQRVDRMIEAGLVNEVKFLMERGYSVELNSMRGLGYKEIASYLKGSVSLEQAIEALKRNTRRFAKRQLTWFRRDERIEWFELDNYSGIESVAKEIARRLEGVFRGL